MANEIIKVNLIPGEEPAPIFHFSQYDNGRTFIAEMYNGEDPFECDDYNVTLECRKRDNNLVIMTADTIDGNVITFHSIEQLCACYGNNDAEIVIRDANDLVIGSGNIIINVEKSPTCGGIQSDTVIENITAQIAQIVPEVIGDDYYNKSQTDALLDNKADRSEIPDMDDYYNKSQTDALLDNKADRSEIPDMDDYYTKAQVNEILFNMLPIGQASGAIASFETEIAAKLTGLETTIVAQGGGGTPSTPIPIVGYSDVNFTNEDDNHTELDSIIIQLGQTVYGGRLYFENGWKCDVTQKIVDMGDLNWSYSTTGYFYATPFPDSAKPNINNNTTPNMLCSVATPDTPNRVYAGSSDNIITNTATSPSSIWIRDNSYTDVATFKTAMTGQKIVYELATPFTIDLSSSDMLDAVVGINNVFSDCGVTTARYKDSIQHYIDSRA